MKEKTSVKLLNNKLRKVRETAATYADTHIILEIDENICPQACVPSGQDVLT